MKLTFYQCDICGKVIGVIDDVGIPTDCCGQTMHEIAVNMTDGAGEKHLPVFEISGNKVTVNVGSIPHPMTEQHSILWVGLRTSTGFHFRKLNPGDAPEASFMLCDGECVEAVLSFCNVHGLWCKKKEACKR